MDAITYADHLVIIKRLAQSNASQRDGLLDEAAAWAARVNAEHSSGRLLRRQIRVLCQIADAHPEAQSRRRARAALAYIVSEHTVKPEKLSELALRARCFVIALMLRDLQAPDTEDLWPAGETDAPNREKAAALLADALSQPFMADDELVNRTRQFCANPPIEGDFLFTRRLLRNAEFLVSVLEERNRREQDRARARAALSYLVTSDHATYDELGLAGLADEAHVLDAAVAAIEPARQAWLRLIETAAKAIPKLYPLTIAGLPTPELPAHAAVEAALLSEPWVSSGPLRTALFVPTTGMVNVLLALAALIEGAARTQNGLVVLAAPEANIRRLLKEVRLAGKSVDELVRIHWWPAEGVLPDGPCLVIVSALSDATLFIAKYRYRVWSALIDLETAAPMPEPAGVRTAAAIPSPGWDDPIMNAYATEARSVPRLSLARETELSIQKAKAQAMMRYGVEMLGSRARALLPADVQFADLTDQHCADVLRRLAPEVRHAKAQLRGEPPTWVEGYDLLQNGLEQMDRTVAELARANLRLVIWVARKYPPNKQHFLDMIQEGNLGLMRAARLFDHTKGANFGSYAILWIRQAISAYLKRAGPVRVPAGIHRSASLIKNAARELTLKLGRPPTADEVAVKLDMDKNLVEQLLQGTHRSAAQLDQPLDDDGSSLKDFLPDLDTIAPSDRIWARQAGAEAQRLLAELPPKEEAVLRLRFGLDTGVPLTLREIGERFGVTRERIRQLENRALARLRKGFNSLDKTAED